MIGVIRAHVFDPEVILTFDPRLDVVGSLTSSIGKMIYEKENEVSHPWWSLADSCTGFF